MGPHARRAPRVGRGGPTVTAWRRATPADAVALRDLESAASRAGLAHVFGDLPYPDDDVLARWVLLLDDPEVVVEVVEDDAGLVVLCAHDGSACDTSRCGRTAGAAGWARAGFERGAGRGCPPAVGAGRQRARPAALRVLRLAAERDHARSARGRPSPPRSSTSLPRIGPCRTTRHDPLLEIADDLYALPLADFTPARDALVKEHKADKDLAAGRQGAAQGVARGLGGQPAGPPRPRPGRPGARRGRRAARGAGRPRRRTAARAHQAATPAHRLGHHHRAPDGARGGREGHRRRSPTRSRPR